MHFVCTYTSGYFPIYDNEYGRVCYDDDDDHVLHDTQGATYLVGLRADDAMYKA